MRNAQPPLITHKMMVCYPRFPAIISVKPNGKYHLEDEIAVLRTSRPGASLTLCQRWPIRTPRPVQTRLPAQRPLITGQRVIDTLFPIAKGGAAAIPGGFGTGKTMTQHQLAKWCDADIIIFASAAASAATR